MKSIMIVTTLLFTTSSWGMELTTRGIYGDDDRIPAPQVKNVKLREMGKSVAAMVNKKALITNPQNVNEYIYNSYALEEELGLCPGEKFGNETMLGSCSGFLISQNYLVTAGHCVVNNTDCRNHQWVFDYYESGKPIRKKNVFGCKKIISRQFVKEDKKNLDYAIIELDREVPRIPLTVRTEGKVKAGTKLAVIGYPMGLPQKIATNAKVAWRTKEHFENGIHGYINERKIDKYVFRANLDAFQGNSGSPVINLKTYEVEGLLIEGSEDYELTDFYGDGNYWCRKVVTHKKSPWNSEELVQRIRQLNIKYKSK